MQFRRELGKAQTQLFSVWKNLFDGELLPAKRSIGIRDLKHHAAYYAVIHFNEMKELSVLHSGTGFDELWGRNIAGSRIAELALDETRDLLDWFFQTMIAHPCGGHSEEVFTKKNGDRYQMDMLYLPILKKNGDTALATIADVKMMGPSDFIRRSNVQGDTQQAVQYADFIDVGFGVPTIFFEGS